MGRLLRGRDLACEGLVLPGFDDFHSSKCHVGDLLRTGRSQGSCERVSAIHVPTSVQGAKIGKFHMAVHHHSLNGLPRAADVMHIHVDHLNLPVHS